ncbi:hypothetical protein [Hymenobacter chitinivorans]|uniref:Uncharacterized protein n=1 Tax=Hymenobacter chitinivorans DSM 11115 TaxID=1121954 RepID=A0A2M9BTB3_9BACT|nr:hypothetical protein [Hymenobacter chitinivorans]PJJ61195.1 hypothetical protein CLV45_2633 [Hymenobacter chitinivorans DSM 11115]
MFLPFLKNPFASKNLSRDNFRDLLQGHLSRLTSQNKAGRYSAMISSLQPHQAAYHALLGAQDENLGQRLGKTDTVEELLAEFKSFAKEELILEVEYQFKRKKPNSEALTAFLPRGRKEYSAATLLTLPTLLQRTATLTAQYKDDLGQALAQRAATLQAAYTTARDDQGEAKGDVQGDSKEEKKLRKATARQLKLNLLDQVKLHIDEPEAVLALYDPKWFTKPAKASEKKSKQP